MKKRRHAAILVQIFLLLACSPPNPFAGTWTEKIYYKGELDSSSVIVFKKDMTFTLSGYTSGGITSGPYSFTDKILEINETHLDGEPEEGYHSKTPYTFRDSDYFEIRYFEDAYAVFERVKD